jgi:large subunit ribosomal protein L5
MESNPMKEVGIEKVTLNIGVGGAGAALENAKVLLERLTGRKAVNTLARVRNPVFKIKRGDPIGAKVTIRGTDALEFAKKALVARDGKLSGRSFDRTGNFSFGVPEYIDFPGAKYDPKIGIIGFDVCVTLRRKGGYRIVKRRRAASRIGRHHVVTKDEAISFAQARLGAQVS